MPPLTHIASHRFVAGSVILLTPGRELLKRKHACPSTMLLMLISTRYVPTPNERAASSSRTFLEAPSAQVCATARDFINK